MKGNEVLMVSGSDQHGTPVTIKAEAEGITPHQVVDKYHQEFLDTWQRLALPSISLPIPVLPITPR